MFSIDAAVSAQLRKASAKAVELRVPVTSKKLAGKLARDVQPSQAYVKLIPDDTSSSGKLVRDEH